MQKQILVFSFSVPDWTAHGVMMQQDGGEKHKMHKILHSLGRMYNYYARYGGGGSWSEPNGDISRCRCGVCEG